MKNLIFVLLVVMLFSCTRKDESISESDRLMADEMVTISEAVPELERFIFISKGKLNGTGSYTKPSYTIIEDSETGIKYLYIWAGMANGGPAITRLWE